MSNELFFKSAPLEMCTEIQEFVDSMESRVLPRKKFALNSRYDAFHVEIRYSWFVQESLWIYDNRKKRFSDRITVAEWYGGDGGQVLTAGWLWRKDNVHQIVQRSWERLIKFEDGEGTIKYTDNVSLWEFRDGKFEKLQVQDSAFLIEKFPLERME